MRTARAAAPNLLEKLRSREAQARGLTLAYAPATLARNTMLYWLARAAKQARDAAGRKQVHIAASIDRDQSVVYRFEQGTAWPRNPDLLVSGYADDLDVPPIEIWKQAITLWEADALSPADVAAAEEAARAAEEAARASAEQRRASGRRRKPK